MGKLYTPTPISNIYSSVNTINQNWDDIADALDLTLARDGSTPNQMESSIDMNSNDIINAGAIYMDQLFVDGARIPSLQEIGETYADMLVALAAGEAAQLAAEQAQAGAETAETNAETAQTAAETAQAAAELAETNAEASETAAALSESNAAASESAASSSASNAASSESNAATSETNAAASESAAATSETNAASSADLAEDWAITPEDTEVPGNPGEFSSLHWAAKAQQAAGSSNLPLITSGDAGKVARVNDAETDYELVDFYNPPATGFVSAGSTEYVTENAGGTASYLDLTSVISFGTTVSVGPTGSGADYITGFLNNIPTGAKAAIFSVRLRTIPAATGATYVTISMSSETSDITSAPCASFEHFAEASQVGEEFESQGYRVVVPLDSNRTFNARWWQLNNDTGNSWFGAALALVGYRY